MTTRISGFTKTSTWMVNGFTRSSRAKECVFSRWTATTWTKNRSIGWRKNWRTPVRIGRSHFFHYPLYSSGERHGPDEYSAAPWSLCSIKYGVSVVFSGHEHFYERLKPQNGISYFIEGGSAKLRKGNIGVSDRTAKGFDTDNTFMLCEINGDEMRFKRSRARERRSTVGALCGLNFAPLITSPVSPATRCRG